MDTIGKALTALGMATALGACSAAPAEDLTTTELGLQSTGQQKLVASNAAAGDRLGNAVAMSGATVLVGIATDDVASAVDRGSAIVYVRSGLGWTAQQQLVAPNGARNAAFGRSVAVAGDTAIVGADGALNAGNTGAVYVFQRAGSTWALSQTLTPEADPASSGFGFALALEGETLVVGGFASAYVFRRENGSFTSRQRLPAPAGATSFGQAVALSGNSILVGSPVLDNNVGPTAPAGAAYVFERSGSAFVQVATISAADAAAASHFGRAVALSGSTALIGADRASGAPVDRGVAYVFVKNGALFTQQARLQVSDGVAGDRLGASVALLGDMALLGAPFHEHQGQNGDHGSAYLFARTAGSWSQVEELRAVDGQNNDFFGSAVTLSGANALVGSPNDDNSFMAQGAAYVFELKSQMGEACGGGAQCPSGLCVDGRCCNAPCAGPCDACSVAAGAARDGECSLVAAGSPGSPACASGACTGTSDLCPGDGTCTTCTTDNDCGSDEYCGSSATCLPRKVQGRTCEATAGADCNATGCRVCASGACVDGFCCESACEGSCSSCSETFTGKPNGTCSSVIASADPKHLCEPNAGSGFIQVSAGSGYTCGVRTDSRLACWGASNLGQTNAPAGTFDFVSTASQSACAIRTGGTVACWGLAQEISGAPTGVVSGLSTRVHHSCATRSNAPPVCWGFNLEGETVPPNELLINVSSGFLHSCGLRPDSSVACWGATLNGFGQANPPPGPFHSLVAGALTSCALRPDNTIACWGLNVAVGIEPPTGTFRVVDLGSGFASGYGCGIRTDDTITCWGLRRMVEQAPPGAFKSLSTGDAHACAIRTDDQVICWGDNRNGELDVPPL